MATAMKKTGRYGRFPGMNPAKRWGAIGLPAGSVYMMMLLAQGASFFEGGAGVDGEKQ